MSRAQRIRAKDDTHYGLALISHTKARSLARKATDLTEWAALIVNS